MELIKLGKKGQLTVPRSVLRAAGIEGEVPLSIEATEDGAIMLRQVGVFPVETYTEERISEFLENSAIPEALVRKAQRLGTSGKKPRK